MAEKVTGLKAVSTTVQFSDRSCGLCPGPLRIACSVNLPHRSWQLTTASTRKTRNQLTRRLRRDVFGERSASTGLHTKYWRTNSDPNFVDGHPSLWKHSRKQTVWAICSLKADTENEVQSGFIEEMGAGQRVALQAALWFLAAGYVIWLFILPNAPGDPVWAISPQTISMLINLSLNFFYVLPILNAGGIHVMESPVVHPTAEALFNFVISWTVMFAPLLFTDRKRDRFGGPLELWWIFQMLLTNTFLIPYMAIRLNAPKEKHESRKPPSLSAETGGFLHIGRLSSAMTSGALTVGATGSVIGGVSVLWFLLGRGEFGSFADRCNFFLTYVNTDRVAYAFLWDLVLYSAFQPWLIGDNLSNLEINKVDLVSKLRFVPYIGLIAYLWGLHGSRKI